MKYNNTMTKGVDEVQIFITSAAAAVTSEPHEATPQPSSQLKNDDLVEGHWAFEASEKEQNEDISSNEIVTLSFDGKMKPVTTEDILPWILNDNEVRAVEGIFNLPMKTKLPTKLLWLATGSGLFMFLTSFAFISYSFGLKFI